MSSFKGKLKEEEFRDVVIDYFDCEATNKGILAFFVSHAHSDHVRGITKLMSHVEQDDRARIFCSPITKRLLMNTYFTTKREMENFIIELEVGEDERICPKDTMILITPLVAEHCAGSLMFLFRVGEVAALYTGDFRMTETNLISFRENFPPLPQLDALYLDTTFWRCHIAFPTWDESTEIISNLIKGTKDEFNTVDIHCPANVGDELLIYELHKKLGKKIYIDEDHCYKYTSCIDDLKYAVTSDGRETNIHFIMGGVQRDCALCGSVDKQTILHITATVQWFHFHNYCDPFFMASHNSWRVLYSSHSNFEEIVNLVRFLRPKAIVPCVVGQKETEDEIVDYITSELDEDSLAYNLT